MDQLKTGKFIAQIRKEHGLTQRELADKLSISDKTVSKWETGKGLPEVSLMIPLCEILGITVNELLSGERLSEDNYKRKTEEVIMDLMRERQENKRKLIIAVAVAVNSLIASLTIFMCVEYFSLTGWQEGLLVAIGLAVLFVGLGSAAALEWNAGTYECPHCKARFVPTPGAYMAGMHTLTRRHLKCPECGKKYWCRRRLSH